MVPEFAFVPFRRARAGIVVVLVDGELRVGTPTARLFGKVPGMISAAAKLERFTGKRGTALDFLAPASLEAARLIAVGCGTEPPDFVKLGGMVLSKLPRAAREATIVLDLPSGTLSAAQAADFALGASLRAYSFDLYKTKSKEDEEKRGPLRLELGVANPSATRRAWTAREGLAKGVALARDLVNEPPNVLHPEEFARRAGRLKRLGVRIEVLTEPAMKRAGMGALLAVGQGSAHQSRTVILRWNGAKAGSAPIAFIGKGVCFDTGGISIKPSAGMEDMKGDMAGAACVVGLLHALAARRAAVNAVGAIGLVENMPDANAQRPGDIVTSMSGQTIEIVNTDAEGRLVLADLLWYVKTRFKPRCMIDLATLTGAIVVALGHEHAGLFSNDEGLAECLRQAGEATGERVWRMPLGSDYDKLIDSKFADVKNTGGREAGSITAAQFLQRFVDKVPWAHIDIAGTGFASAQTDINPSWASGWGVRLLDRAVSDQFEK
jgi:leucyl aminopeptidase